MPFHITTPTRAVAGSSTIHNDIKDTLFEVVMDRLWYQSDRMLYFCGDTIGWVTSRTHSPITYFTSIAQEIGHYSEAGKTILAARHKRGINIAIEFDINKALKTVVPVCVILLD